VPKAKGRKRWSKGVKGNYHIKIARGGQEARVSADL